MNSTKVVAITSWTKPGAVISSVRMQPPMRSLRSSSRTLPPFLASRAAQTSALMPLPTMMWSGAVIRASPPVTLPPLLLLRYERQGAHRAAGALLDLQRSGDDDGARGRQPVELAEA